MEKSMNEYAVLFDMDGVIFDSESIWKECMKLTNKLFGISFNEKFRQKLCGQPESGCKELLKSKFPELDADAYWTLLQTCVYTKMANVGIKIKSGFLEIITYLKQNNIKTALVTGGNRVDVQFKKANLNINELFDVVLTAKNYSRGKPDPMPYQMAAEKLGVPPQKCYVLEDGINGILSAYNAHCRPIMVIDLIKPTKDIKEKCVLVTKNLKNAQKFIINQQKK